MLLRASESGIRGHRQVISGMCVNVDGSEVVWRSQPRARSSISHYALEAGSTRLARKMDTYITSNMAELPKMLGRRDTSEPMHVSTCTYLLLQSTNLISSRGDYSRAASIWFRACSGAATIREQCLFESGVYSVIYSICDTMRL